MARKWIKGALRRHPKGALHRQLGIPQDEKIPTSLVQEAAKHPDRFVSTYSEQLHLKRRALLALRLRTFRHKRR